MEKLNKIYKCKYCDLEFDNRHKLAAHIGYYHNHNKKFKCKYCNMEFENHCVLGSHIKNIHKKIIKPTYTYKCEKCNTVFYKNKKIKKGRRIHCDICKRKVVHSKDDFVNIKDLSSRTISKILKKLNMKCSICGWNKATCDIHHILPKKCGGTDDNNNLIILCPNCHRMVHNHSNEITKEMLLDNSLDKVFKQIKGAYHSSN